MNQSNDTIVEKRQRILVRVRAAALALFVLGSMPLIHIGVLWFFKGRLGNWTWIMSEPVSYGIMLLVPAFLLTLLDRRIVRWLIPVPRHECPQCGYALRQLTTARCPECGFVFSAASDNEPPPPR